MVDNLSKANLIQVHYELTEKRREEVDNNMTMDPGSNSRMGGGGKSDRYINRFAAMSSHGGRKGLRSSLAMSTKSN